MSASTWWIFALVQGKLRVESEDERNSGADICQAELGGEWRMPSLPTLRLGAS